MNLYKKSIFLILLAVVAAGVRAETLLVSRPDSEARVLSSKTQHQLDARVIKLCLVAYNNAVKQGYTHKKILTIVDFSKPSTLQRFFVFDLHSHRLLFNELVAHGKYSGGKHAVSFSNEVNSNKSSLGVYVTENTYHGKRGYSLRLNGLERGYNDNVKRRGVVVHGSQYVTNEFAQAAGQLGRSQGCLALSPRANYPVINTIKHGTMIIVYHPGSTWASNSQFLKT